MFGRAFVRSLGRSFVHTCIRAVVLAFVCLLMCSFSSSLPSIIGSCGRWFVRSAVHSVMCSLLRVSSCRCVRSGVRSFARSFLRSVGRSLVRAYVHSCGRTCVCVSVNVFVQSVASVNDWFVRSVVCSFGRSFGPVFVPSCNPMSLCSIGRSFVRSVIPSVGRSVGRSFVYTLVCAVMRASVRALYACARACVPSLVRSFFRSLVRSVVAPVRAFVRSPGCWLIRYIAGCSFVCFVTPVFVCVWGWFLVSLVLAFLCWRWFVGLCELAVCVTCGGWPCSRDCICACVLALFVWLSQEQWSIQCRYAAHFPTHHVSHVWLMCGATKLIAHNVEFL